MDSSPPAVGDVWLVIIDTATTGQLAYTPPAGWSWGSVYFLSGAQQIQCFWKAITGSEGSSATFGGLGANYYQNATSILISGADTISPIRQSVGNYALSVLSVNALAVTVDTNDLLRVNHYFEYSSTLPNTTQCTPPAGYTEKIDFNNSSVTGTYSMVSETCQKNESNAGLPYTDPAALGTFSTAGSWLQSLSLLIQPPRQYLDVPSTNNFSSAPNTGSSLVFRPSYRGGSNNYQVALPVVGNTFTATIAVSGVTRYGTDAMLIQIMIQGGQNITGWSIPLNASTCTLLLRTDYPTQNFSLFTFLLTEEQGGGPLHTSFDFVFTTTGNPTIGWVATFTVIGYGAFYAYADSIAALSSASVGASASMLAETVNVDAPYSKYFAMLAIKAGATPVTLVTTPAGFWNYNNYNRTTDIGPQVLNYASLTTGEIADAVGTIPRETFVVSASREYISHVVVIGLRPTYLDVTPSIASVENIPTADASGGLATNDPLRFGLDEDAVEIISARRRDRKLYQNPDGSKSEVLGAQWHYLDDGTFYDMDLNFYTVGTNLWQVEAHDVIVTVSTDPVNPYIMTIERETGRGIKIVLPAVPSLVNRNYVTFTWRGISWAYYVRYRGLKLSGYITSTKGYQIYSFAYETVDIIDPDVDSVGNVVGEVFTIPRPVIKGNDYQFYPTGQWVVDQTNKLISLVVNDYFGAYGIPIPAPYTIDPTQNYNVTADANDQYVLGLATTNPPATYWASYPNTTELLISRTLSGGYYYVYYALIKIDTSRLPSGAFITRFRLRFYLTQKNAPQNPGLNVDWYTFVGAAADYVQNQPTNAAANVSLASAQVGSVFEVELANPQQYVNLYGQTGLRIGLTPLTPSAINQIAIASSEHTTLPEPYAVVDYIETTAIKDTQYGNTGAGGTSITFQNRGIAEGDLLIIALYGGYGAGISTLIGPSYPASFVSIPNCDVSASASYYDRLQAYRKVATASEPGTYTVSWTGTRIVSAIFVVIAGAQRQNPIDASNVTIQAGSATTMSAPSINGATGERLLCFFGLFYPTPISLAAGSALHKEIEGYSATSPYYGFMLASKLLSAVGATGVQGAVGGYYATERVGMAITIRQNQYLYPTSIDSVEDVPIPTVAPAPLTLTSAGAIQSAESIEIATIQSRMLVYNPPAAPASPVSAPQILRGMTPVAIAAPDVFGTATILPQAATVTNAGAIIAYPTVPNVPKIQSVVDPSSISTAEFVSPAGVEVAPPLPVILDTAAKMEALKLSGERGRVMYTPRLFLSDIYGNELQELPGAIGATIDMANDRDIAWQLQLDCLVTDAFDPAHDYVLVALDVSSDLIASTSRYYMGLYRFDLPGGVDQPDGSLWKLTGHSLEFLLSTGKATLGFDILRRDYILQAVIRLLTTYCGVPLSRIAFPPGSVDVRHRTGWHVDALSDGDDSIYLSIANNLLGQAGYEALQADNFGRLTTRPARAGEDKHPNVFYGPRASGGDAMLLNQPIDFKPDYSKFANEVMVSSNETSEDEPASSPDCQPNTPEEPIVPINYTARNLNPNSPVSIQNLGYTVTKTVELDHIANLKAAKRIARAELAIATTSYLSREIQTMIDPRRTIDEAYRAEATNRRGILVLDGNWAVTGWSFPLPINGPPGVMKHTISRIEPITEDWEP